MANLIAAYYGKLVIVSHAEVGDSPSAKSDCQLAKTGCQVDSKPIIHIRTT